MKIRDFSSSTDVVKASELFGQLGYPTTAETLRVRAAANERDPAVKVLVAEDCERVVGVLVVHLLTPWHEDTRWAVVSALVVDNSARSKGTGALLLHEAETFARAMGCSHLELSSSEARLRAHAFYERAGFREVRKRFVKILMAIS
jgi:GNAT superfamily N-acetyltransferase